MTVERDGSSIELTLGGPELDAVDHWAVDWNHDGRVFRHDWRSSRRNARDRVTASVRRVHPDEARRVAAVRVADAAGNETRWTFE